MKYRFVHMLCIVAPILIFAAFAVGHNFHTSSLVPLAGAGLALLAIVLCVAYSRVFTPIGMACLGLGLYAAFGVGYVQSYPKPETIALQSVAWFLAIFCTGLLVEGLYRRARHLTRFSRQSAPYLVHSSR